MYNKITKNSQEILVGILLFGLMFLVSGLFAQHQIGHTQITFQDASRGNRNIQTEIYYPASVSGNDVQMAPGTYPVIVFGHGFVMAWDAYENLWEEFVSRGYIMLFPRTEGSIIGTDHQKFGWDLQFLVGQMQTEGVTPSSIFFQGVASETALMGHSMGGGAAFLAADSLVTNGNTNLKTLIGLAPAESSTNGVSSINSATQITLPSLILSGSNDGVTPTADHHIPMYNNLASDCKTFINILGGGHCYYANSNFNCDFGESTSSNGISITRAEQQQVTYDFVNLWLDYTLKGDCNSFDVFNDSIQNSNRVDFNQSCTLPVFNVQHSDIVCEGESYTFPDGIVVNNVTSQTTHVSNLISVNCYDSIVETTVNVTVIDVTVNQLNQNTLEAQEIGANYQWIDCSDNSYLVTENNQSLIITQNGDFAVEITQNGCVDTSICTNITLVGFNDFFKNEINYYPNPTNNLLFFEGLNLTNADLKIINVLGEEVFNYAVLNEKIISLSQLSEGVYFININKNIYRIVLFR